ncbi:DUF3800 domain-containing protein [Raoultibacter timonensis]|uniref:DUF3800 domain-containing protein n=1 Tax=Raoultibacter timonensis TaxID=1907662 RepID=UPI0026DB2646|nr:DUF3800 domain-containing protein [Raoultibacter timonensis]
MNIFVYGDESGVFDKAHNDIFVFGGLVFLNKKDRDEEYRKFISAERKIMPSYGMDGTGCELKACRISNKHKAGLFRSTNGRIRYAIIVNQSRIHDEIFGNKKSKQRYLDYAYKVGLKNCFGRLIRSGALDPSDVDNLYIRFDEHTTATDGRYELREAIEEEFKHGTINYRYNTFHKPVFPNMRGGVSVDFRDSKNDALIRASDIIANQARYLEASGKGASLSDKLLVSRFP